MFTISKVTDNDFNESTGNRLLQSELEKKQRIKTYFHENDKTPNTDGYFEVLDRRGVALKRFVVQIKTVCKMTRLRNGDYSYSVDTAFLQYVLENIDQNPAVFFIVDLSGKRIYFKYLFLEYLLPLGIGRKKKKTIHLNESDILDEDRFYNFCMSLIRQSMVEDSRALTKVLLPSPDELFHYEHIDEANITRRYPIYPMPVGTEESRMLGIPPAILEKYEDIRLLGSGGRSKVFSLTSKLTGSKVALKVTPITEPSSRPLLKAFKSFDTLRHPSILRVLDYFVESETEYMIMDLIEGHNLQELVSAGAFNLAEIIAIIAELCDVAHFLHLHGYVHRDIKPSNIMVVQSHGIKLVDLDLAIGINGVYPNYSFVGTMRYAAPETYDPEYSGAPASDIFSIGATLYYSLLNEETRKFLKSMDSGFELCEYIANYTGDELGNGLDILKKALAFDPRKRYGTAKRMQEDLMLWQKKEFLEPSALNLALARNRENYYKGIFHGRGNSKK